MTIRLAGNEDLEKIYGMVRTAIRHMEDQGIHQWDEIYPDRTMLQTDIEREQMHVIEAAGGIAGMIVINEDFPREYNTILWEYPGRALVIHRLTIDPNHQGEGLATRLMRFAETIAVKQRYDTIRLDAFTENSAAIHLYKHLGYRMAGAVRFRKGIFFCYEKQLKDGYTQEGKIC